MTDSYNELLHAMDDLGLLLAMSGIFLVIGLIGYLIQAVSLFFLFKKAGHPKAWGAWIPFYNTYLFLLFGGQKALWFWIYLATFFVTAIPFIGSIAGFVGSVMYTIAYVYAIIFINKSFGKEENLVLWTIFGFLLAPIWALVLGLSANTYYFRANGPLFLNNDGYPPAAWN